MSEGHGRDAWSRDSVLLAMIANVNLDVKKHPKPYTPKDFDPYEASERKQKIAGPDDLRMLRGRLEGMKKKNRSR